MSDRGPAAATGADAGTHSPPWYLYPRASSFRMAATRCLSMLLTVRAPRYSSTAQRLRRQMGGGSDVGGVTHKCSYRAFSNRRHRLICKAPSVTFHLIVRLR